MKRPHANRLLLPALLSMAGCAQLGAVSGVVAQAIPRRVDAAYKGLAGQQVIVMAWADQGIRIDNPQLQEDLAAAVQDKLIQVQVDEKPDALKGTAFPVATAAVVRYQADHPEAEFEPATDTAAKFNGSRLVYLEVTDFATRSDASLALYRGTLTANLKVVEMHDDGHGKVTAKVAYDGGTLHVDYPKDSPKEGLPVGTDYKITQGTLDAFTDAVAKRFYLHDEDRT